MIVFTIDLTIPSQHAIAIKCFALDLYLPAFGKNKLKKDSEKQIKVAEIRKQFKKIRTNISVCIDHIGNTGNTNETTPLYLVLAIIVSSIVDTKVKVSVSALKGATQWETFSISADLKQMTPLAEIKLQRLIESASHVGHYHCKPFNTLSSVQFCRDPNYLATGEFGFTENQLDNNSACLSISGGSNAFSAFYTIFISRINGISIAEHLIDTTAIAGLIQQFFSYFIPHEALNTLKDALQQALTKTASDIGDALHVMDKQITLPIINANNECEYLNITPVTNPTVFAATSRSLFYVKGQSIRFMNIELGGSNPSNAGTAVGEVSGQNSRLQLSFPQQNIDYIEKILMSLKKQRCFFWPKQFKKQLRDNLLQYANNSDIPNDKKRKLLKKTVQLAIEKLQQQLHEMSLYLHPLSEQAQKKMLNKQYLEFFTSNKLTPKHYIIWQDTLIYSIESLPNTTIDYEPVIKEIKRQFKQIQHNGGF